MVSHRRAETRTTRLAVAATVLALLAGACGHSKPSAAKPVSHSSSVPSPSPSPAPPPVCPLTGQLAPGGSIPNRPALAIKVENSPDARPQTGLSSADIVYEEPVEGGITRFVAIYQCQGAARVEPVRSARLQDIDILAQFSKPLFANAGGSPPTEQALAAAVTAGTLVNIDYSGAGYHRDPARGNGIHSLYTSTQELLSRPDAHGGPVPAPVFTYSPSPAPGAPGAVLHVNFSQYSDVVWKWNASANVYQRYYGNAAANQSDGSIISTPNVVIQFVPVAMSWFIEDPSGSHQPVPTLTGTGAAVICRQGTCVTGTWSRPAQGQVTQFHDATGAQIALVPGATWVELAPSSVSGATPIPVAQVTETAQ